MLATKQKRIKQQEQDLRLPKTLAQVKAGNNSESLFFVSIKRNH